MKQKMYSCDARVILSILIGLFLSCNVFAQDVTIKGNVKDAKGEPIIGASILEKGTTNGTVTDFDGNFMLSAPKGSTIGISYIGYKSQDIINQGQSNLIVVLQEDTEVLDEIVVIGYGTVKKDDATGSVTAIKPDKMNRGLTTTATDMINGKIAGVNITTDGGAPGSGASIRIRGGSSLSASNNPLIVIDGLPIDNDGIKGVSNPLSTINPNDIATFTVLKDASATAIYGSRASNGVILITTKKGEKGSRPRFTYDGNVSISTKTKSIDVMGADEYRNFVTDRFGAESSAVKLLGKENTDWQKEIFRTAVGTDHNITVSGGLNNMPYRVSVGYTNQNGILKTSKFERYTGSVNLAPSFFEDHLNINFNAKGMISNNRFADTGAIGAAIAFDPTQPVMNGNSKYGGYFAWENAGEFISIATKNPVAMLQQKKEEANSKNLVGNIQVDYKFHFLPELRANLNLGMDMATGTQDIYYPKESPLGYVDNGKTGYETIDKYNHLLDFYLQYAKDFNEKHHFDIMAGYSWQHFHRSTENAYNNLNGDNPTSYIFKTESYLISFFGRVNYDFQSKYLISGTFRADGSSKFSKGNRWGYFPSAAVAWRISSEKFMEKTQNWLDDLKIRFSYGTAGNNNIPADQTSPVWSSGSTTWLNQFPSYWTSGIASGQSGSYASNPDLKWETTVTRNVGLDYTLFGGKLTGSIEYYKNTTKDLLIAFPVSGSGYDYQYRNLGKTENKGFEISLTWNIISKKNYELSFNGNVGFNKNKVKNLGTLSQYPASSGWASTQIQDDFIVKPGHSVGEIYGYVTAGRYEVSDFEDYYASGEKWVLKQDVANNAGVIGASYLRPGALKLKNIDDSDNVIDEKDRTVIGNTNPKASGGFALSGRVYGFDLSANFTYSIGNDVYNANKIEYTSSYQYYYRNMIDIMAEGKRWTNLDANGNLVNDPAQLAALNANTTMWSPYTSYVLTDWAVEDGSFLRLSTLTVGYTLPQSLTRKVGINNLRFYATCYNVFCLTGYSGFDPEVSTRNKTALTPGVDYSAYPKSRQFVIGLNLNF